MSNLVVTNNGGNIMVGGYAIEPSLGITTFNGKREEDNRTSGTIQTVSDIFKGLAVPAGLFMMQDNLLNKKKDSDIELIHKNVVDSKLYDTLLNNVTLKEKQKLIKNTRKRRNMKNKRTRKNKSLF